MLRDVITNDVIINDTTTDLYASRVDAVFGMFDHYV